MKRLPIIAAVLAVLAVLVYSSIFIINERDQAIVMRFGEIRRVEQDPGLYFKVPTNFVETVQIIEDRLLSFEIVLCAKKLQNIRSKNKVYYQMN